MAKKVALAFQELALALMAKKNAPPPLYSLPGPRSPAGRDGGRGRPGHAMKTRR
jgi:hypothetical protein